MFIFLHNIIDMNDKDKRFIQNLNINYHEISVDHELKLVLYSSMTFNQDSFKKKNESTHTLMNT